MSKTLDRIAKVLNQAENAATPEEAAAFMERAQHLSTLAQIDLAVARAHTVNKEKREEVVVDHRVQVNPFNRRFNRKYFMDLGAAIAEANDCKVLYGGRDYFLYLTGFPSDIEVVEALFGVLAVQMVSECDTALKRGANKTVKRVAKRERVEIPDEERAWGEPINPDAWDSERYYARDEYEHERFDFPLPPKYRLKKVRDENGAVVYEEQAVSEVDGRHYRQNFYDGFIGRTRSRLWEAKRAARTEAGADDESSSTAVALRDKKKEVDEKFDDRLKTLNSRGKGYSGAQTSVPVVDAWKHGSDAAARAKIDLDDDNAVGASTTKEIG